MELQLLEARGDHDRLLAAIEPMMAETELERSSPYRSYRRVLPPWIGWCLVIGRVAEARQALHRYEYLVVRWPDGPEADGLGLLGGLLAEAGGDIDVARRHFADDLADPQVRARPLQLARLQLAAVGLEVNGGATEYGGATSSAGCR